MPALRSCVWPFAGLLLLACSNSTSGSINELASARIDADGGELRVDSGPQAGLILTVPAGALAQPTTLRIVQVVPPPLPTGTAGIVEPTQPGLAFRLEPIGVQFITPATLRMPFMPEVLYYRTGLGNVRVRQDSVTGTWEREPLTIDVAKRFVETSLNIGGELQVVEGPRAQSLHDYFPARGVNVLLEGGGSFRSENMIDARFPARDLYRWRLQLAPTLRDFGYVLEDAAFVGRFDLIEDWLEMWPAASAVEQLHSLADGYVYQAPFSTSVYRPSVTSLPIGGIARLRTAWRFREPLVVAGQRVLDVLELRVGVAWQRGDMADGSEDMVLWFAPGHGLLGVRDGTQEILRTSL